MHELPVKELVDEFVKAGVRTTSSKIMPLTPAQLEIIADPARFKVLSCGRRFGKSITSTLIALAVVMNPGRKVWIVSEDYGLTDRIFDELYHILVNELKIIVPGKIGAASKQTRNLQLPNGSTIDGKSIQNRSSLVGDAIDLLIWDECALTSQGKQIWDQELSSVLIDRKGSVMFISTPRGRNHFYDFYNFGQDGLAARKKDPQDRTEHETFAINWASFKFSSYYNTKEKGGYLDKTEIDIKRIGMSDLKFRQEHMADFTAVADNVFPEFNQETQVVDWDFTPTLPVEIGMDFNYQTPCTTLYLQVDPSGNVLVFDEYFPEGGRKTVHDQAKQLLAMDQATGKRISTIAADIAGKQVVHNGRSPWDDLADYNIFPVGKKQKIETGCDLIRLLCAYPKLNANGTPMVDANGNSVVEPKLFINKRCKNLIYALEAARAPEGRDGNSKEGYRKDGRTDGPLDALRYILVYLFASSEEVNITSVR